MGREEEKEGEREDKMGDRNQ